MVRPEVKKKRREAAEAAIRSRKERKKLEQVVLRKRHKINRNDVLAELKKVQLSADHLDRLHSTSSMQTKGLKRFSNDHSYSDGGFDSSCTYGTPAYCTNASQLIKRKRRKIRDQEIKSETPLSSSEDTDAISTDDEIDGTIDEKVVITKVEPAHTGPNEPNAFDTSCDSTEQKVKVELPVDNKNPMKDENEHAVLTENNLTLSKPAVYVEVSRDVNIQENRLKLPIINEEHRIMEEIYYNDVVIISGETGSGKTTQLPQFLYEAGYTLGGRMIGITEPRRVAAISMSERVSEELNMTGGEVSYQIRFSGTVSENTQIKFMTDGVLLKECQRDLLLSKYSVLIIDEAHERSVSSDILIGLLSRVVPLRAKKGNPLKLVIMSATLRVSDFTDNPHLFPKTPPIIDIDARQYPVNIKFESRTPDNYIEAAYKKIIKINRSMPLNGGILVFVTSQMDVKILCKRLKKKARDLHCLGLYAMLPIEKQKLVFKKPPDATRLCVVATNVAETSITIPNIKYVVDSGLEKRKQYDSFTGISRFVTTWTSKSSAQQRAGRAGRMGPGHCYRLYSSAVFTNDFSEFSEPQILQRPVEDVLLQMKTMNIDNVVNFPFPTRPSIDSLKAAEKRLILLGALDNGGKDNVFYFDLDKTEYASRPTRLGKAMSKFSVSARCSKMIILSPPELLPYVVALVSALSVREMFSNVGQFKDLRKKWAGGGSRKKLGDFMVMLRGIMLSESKGCSAKLQQENGLRPAAMLEIDKLRRQLADDIKNNLKYKFSDVYRKIKKPDDAQCDSLRQLLLSSFCDHVAKRIPDGEITANNPINEEPKANGAKKRLKNAYECKDCDDPIYISTESVLRGQHPDYLIYKELYRGDKKTYMRDVASIEPGWLSFALPLVS